MEELDPVGFTFDFTVSPSEKAVAGTVAYELDDGDLLIEGTGLNFEVDREDEAFEDSGLLQKSLDTFIAAGGPLCWHHKRDQVLGRVLEANVIEGKGVKIKARVDCQPESSPLRGIYEQIRKGTITGLSAAGRFRRRMTPNGPRIFDSDIYEWSATAVPVGRNTTFSVIAGKALASDLDAKHVVIPAFPEDEIREEDFMWAQESIATLDRIFERLSQRNSTSNRTTTI